MIKKTFRGIGRVLKPLVNFPAWMNWQGLKENHQKIKRLAQIVLTPQRVQTTQETFAEAVARLGLDEATITARQQYFKQLAMCYLVLAALLFAYMLYLAIIVQTFLGVLMTLVAIWVVLVLAFRQHFWYIQMKVRRLGLNFTEWFSIAFHIKNGG